MEIGKKYREKHTDLICTVTEIASHHCLVEFESGMRAMISKCNYKNFKEVIEGE